MSKVIELADKLSVKSHQRTDSLTSPSPTALNMANAGSKETSRAREDEDERGFEILANVVWEEFGRAIMDDLGSVVFSSGRPAEFRKVCAFLTSIIILCTYPNCRKNHEVTEAFIRSLEYTAPSALSVERMRTHPVYISFQRRWQLPVYFQLRWKEIVGKLEDTLTSNRLELLPTQSRSPNFS